MSIHSRHPDVVKRLRRAEGHLRSTIGMIEAGRECLDVAQQLHAIEKAIESAKKIFIHDHIDHCLERAAGRMDRRALGEFREIAKYL